MACGDTVGHAHWTSCGPVRGRPAQSPVGRWGVGAQLVCIGTRWTCEVRARSGHKRCLVADFVCGRFRWGAGTPAARRGGPRRAGRRGGAGRRGRAAWGRGCRPGASSGGYRSYTGVVAAYTVFVVFCSNFDSRCSGRVAPPLSMALPFPVPWSAASDPQFPSPPWSPRARQPRTLAREVRYGLGPFGRASTSWLAPSPESSRRACRVPLTHPSTMNPPYSSHRHAVRAANPPKRTHRTRAPPRGHEACAMPPRSVCHVANKRHQRILFSPTAAHSALMAVCARSNTTPTPPRSRARAQFSNRRAGLSPGRCVPRTNDATCRRPAASTRRGRASG